MANLTSPTGAIQRVVNAVNPSGIDQLKSMIGRRGGLADPTRFVVAMRPPERSWFNLDIRDITVRVLSDSFQWTSLFNDPRDITFLCESCSLPGRQISSLERTTWRQPIKAPTGYLNDDVTFTFVCTNDFYIKRLFDAWQNLIIDEETFLSSYANEYKTDVIIMQLNSRGFPIYSVKLKGAFPITFQPIELNNASSNTYSKINVTMTYDDHERIEIEQGVLESIPFEDLRPGAILDDLRRSLPSL